MPSQRNKIRAYKEPITAELAQVLAGVPDTFTGLSSHSVAALKKLQEYSLRPGKRVRGALAAYAYDYAAKKTFGDSGLRAGVALEIAQSYLLIIDDVMDKSELRRGGPSLHQLYRQEQRDDHTADMMAVDVGLIAQHVMNLVLSSIDEDPARVLRAANFLHKNLCVTGFGQLDDLAQTISEPADEEEIIRKYASKSSHYTFVNPLQVGLALAGIDDEHVFAEAERFGVAAGIAFQLHDDVLGVFGDTALSGKSTVDDIQEGKYTLLLQHSLEHGSAEDVRLLKQAVGTPDLDSRTFQRVQKVLEANGSRAYAEAKAKEYAIEAKRALEDSTFWDHHAKTELAALVDYSVTRES